MLVKKWFAGRREALYSQKLADAFDICLTYGSGMAQSQFRFFGLLTHEVRSASLAAHDLARSRNFKALFGA